MLNILAKRLSLDDFKRRAYVGMKCRDVEELFGLPERDEGSGIFVYVFTLVSGDLVKVGCGSDVLYVRHTDENGVLLEELYQRNPLELKDLA